MKTRGTASGSFQSGARVRIASQEFASRSAMDGFNSSIDLNRRSCGTADTDFPDGPNSYLLRRVLVCLADDVHRLSADVALLSLVILFRALKNLVTAIWPADHARSSHVGVSLTRVIVCTVGVVSRHSGHGADMGIAKSDCSGDSSAGSRIATLRVGRLPRRFVNRDTSS